MSGDVPFQHVPLDKLKVYRNHVRVNNILRKLNFSIKFSLTEVPGTDSVDIDITEGGSSGSLDNLTDVDIINPAVLRQVIIHNGTNWSNRALVKTDLPSTTAFKDEANIFTETQQLNGIKLPKIITPPADGPLEDCEIYWKQIDGDNNGLFIKGKKGGVIVEGQIF